MTAPVDGRLLMQLRGGQSLPPPADGGTAYEKETAALMATTNIAPNHDHHTMFWNTKEHQHPHLLDPPRCAHHDGWGILELVALLPDVHTPIECGHLDGWHELGKAGELMGDLGTQQGDGREAGDLLATRLLNNICSKSVKSKCHG